MFLALISSCGVKQRGAESVDSPDENVDTELSPTENANSASYVLSEDYEVAELSAETDTEPETETFAAYATDETEEITAPTPEITTIPQVDPSASYPDQIQEELAQYGLTEGVQIFPGDTESDIMGNFMTQSCTRESLDVSGDNVPFTAAERITVSRDMTNWWDASYMVNLTNDVKVHENDLIAGVMWIRGTRLPGSTWLSDSEPPIIYPALKTPTDNWASEGGIKLSGIQIADGLKDANGAIIYGQAIPDSIWHKVIFTGRILNEESQTSNVEFHIFMGFGIQQIDVGGITAYVYPSTPDNEKAVINLTY